MTKITVQPSSEVYAKVLLSNGSEFIWFAPYGAAEPGDLINILSSYGLKGQEIISVYTSDLTKRVGISSQSFAVIEPVMYKDADANVLAKSGRDFELAPEIVFPTSYEELVGKK